MGHLLGFTGKKYFGECSYMGEIPVNAYASLPYFYLAVDDFQNRSVACFQPAFSQITMSPSKLARISLNQMTKEPKVVSIPRKYFGPIDITRLQIKLLDPHGKNMRLNTNFSLCLVFDVIYDL
jgi:hypothetical protein